MQQTFQIPQEKIVCKDCGQEKLFYEMVEDKSAKITDYICIDCVLNF